MRSLQVAAVSAVCVEQEAIGLLSPEVDLDGRVGRGPAAAAVREAAPLAELSVGCVRPLEDDRGGGREELLLERYPTEFSSEQGLKCAAINRQPSEQIVLGRIGVADSGKPTQSQGVMLVRHLVKFPIFSGSLPVLFRLLMLLGFS